MSDDIITKLDRLDERLDRMSVSQERHNTLLEMHMKRSDAIEARVEQVASELAPLKKHVSMWAGAGKALAVLATLLGVVAGLMKMLG